MKKRVLSVITALALCLTLLPVTALATDLDFAYSEDETEDKSGEGYSWDASERTLVLTGDIDGNIGLPNDGGNDDGLVTIRVDNDCTVTGDICFSNYDYSNLLITGEGSLKFGGLQRSGGAVRLTVETNTEIQSGLELGESGGMDSVLIIRGATLTVDGDLTLLQTLVMEEQGGTPARLNIAGNASFHNTLDDTSASMWPDASDSGSKPTSQLDASSVIKISDNNLMGTLYQENSGMDDDFNVVDLFGDFLPEGYEFKDLSVWETGADEQYTGPLTLKKQFTVTVTDDSNGTASASLGKASEGTEITLTATPNGEYELTGWEVDPESVVITDDKFTMPAADVTVTPIFEIPAPPTYTVSYDANGGSGEMESVSDVSGSYTLPENGFTPPADHQFKAWVADDADSEDYYNAGSSYDVSADTVFYAVWEPVPEDPVYSINLAETEHGTVESSHLQAGDGDTVRLTVTPEQGYELKSLVVTDGDGNEIETTCEDDGIYTFRMPEQTVTVTASFESEWDMEYQDCPRDETCPYWPYTDTDTNEWYHDGVHFCVDNGLMIGYGNNIFKPYADTTRAMITMMLWRLEGCPGVDYRLDFEDVPEGAWYTEAIRWAKSEGLVIGYGNGFFGPDDVMTREQMVTILWRYSQYRGDDVSVGENTSIGSYSDAGSVSEYAIDAMRWACGSGVIVGLNASDGDGLILDPKGATTRAQMATMMMRFPEWHN